jgi:hypothetical protein
VNGCFAAATTTFHGRVVSLLRLESVPDSDGVTKVSPSDRGGARRGHLPTFASILCVHVHTQTSLFWVSKYWGRPMKLNLTIFISLQLFDTLIDLLYQTHPLSLHVPNLPRFSSRRSRARPSRWMWNRPIRLTMSRPRFKTRKAFRPISSA